MKQRRTFRRELSFLSSATRDLLFPPRCVGCDELLPPFAQRTTVLCPLCSAAWETALKEAANHAARDAEQGLAYLVHYRPGNESGSPEKLIYHIKHKGDPRAFSFVAEQLVPRIREIASTSAADKPEGEEQPLLFTYPPRRRSAVNQDGFDQAERLARATAKACGGDFAPLIRRTHRRTAEQKSLNAEERVGNASSSYILSRNAADVIPNRTVVICDDLCTTGATLNRCAELLVTAGAKRVILCTVAQTRKRDIPNG